MPVVFEKRGHIGIVTLSRPQARNAWGADFNEGIARHFAAMEDDDEIRCAVLTGDEAGGAFSAGANLKDPKTHTMASSAAFIKGLPKRRDRAFEILGNFPEAPGRRRQRLRRRDRLHRDLLLRSARGLGARGMAVAAGCSRYSPRLWRGGPPCPLGRTRQCHAPGHGVPPRRGGGAPYRARPVGGAPCAPPRSDARGGDPPRVAASACRLASPRSRSCGAWTFRTCPMPRSSTSIASPPSS